MKSVRGGLLASLTLAAVALLDVNVAAADLAGWLRPVNLRVAGGENAWHPESYFRLDWDRPPAATAKFPITAVDYRVRDASGAVVVAEVRLPWDTTQLEDIRVPPVPGAYTADVWLESMNGERGPQASATLRFDDAPPGLAQPLAPAGWIAADTATAVTIQRPPVPWPISGIRGYAVSVDRGTGSVPCSTRQRCSPAEIDLPGGIDDSTLPLGILPEGISVVRAVAVSGSGVSSAEIGSAVVRVDATRPQVVLTGAPRGWASGPMRLVAIATDALSGMAVGAGPSGPYTAIAIDGGVPKAEPGDSATVTVAGEGTHRLAFYARDAAGNAGDGSPHTAAVSIDESPPNVVFAKSQDPTEPERIEATVTDLLSGPDPARGSIAVRPAGSRQRWLPLATAVMTGRLAARWDSDSFAPGTYEFRATGYDVAGNATGSDQRGNGARMVLANPLKAPTRIEAGFGGRRLLWHSCRRKAGQRRCRRGAIRSFEGRPATRTVPYGRGISYSGRLTSPTGSPLGNLPVQVVESFEAGARSSQRSTTVLTASDGSFAVRLLPGPSRRIEAGFPGSRVLTRASGGEVRMDVLAGVRMRTSSASARIGGAPIVFSGRVSELGAPIAAGGRPVELQFKLSGGEWAEFRTVQTDRHGRFRYPYAFSDDDSHGVRFQFRAYAPAQAGWPYEPAASRPVVVTGR
jgi:hypothetical protein